MRRLSAVSLIVAAFIAIPAAHARDGKVLDSQRVESRAERVVFTVGRQQGRLTGISFRSLDDAMLLKAVEIRYGNGEWQRVDFLRRLTPGEESEPIDLEGERRHIEQVVVWKRPAFRPWVVGELQLIGVGRPEREEAAQFEVVDKQSTDNRSDRIVFRVGRREGRFAAIKFRATFEPLLVSGVEIEFANGERQETGFIERLLPGRESRVLDLEGEARRIETVTLWKRPSWRPGRVTAELLGAEGPDRAPSWGGVGPAIPRGWVLFGAQSVDFSADRDIIPVGAEVGRFERIALRVFDNDIFLREITVVYANGERDRKVIETEIRANSQTRAIDLEGDRFIRQIELLYRSRPGGRRDRAVVEVYGDYAGGWLGERGGYREHQGGWVLLGAQRAAMFAKDTDAIHVGERFGRFRAIRLAARREDVRIYTARIVYGNGETEDLPVSGTLKEGQSTRVFDLSGRGRFIERIELKYRSKLTLKGQGVIEVWGLS